MPSCQGGKDKQGNDRYVSSGCAGDQGIEPAAAKKNPDGYWKASRNNPIGSIGRAAGLNSPSNNLLGSASKNRLLGSLMHKYGVIPGYSEHGYQVAPLGNMAAVYREYKEIRGELAEADAYAVSKDNLGVPHLLSATQITIYHWSVFESHGLGRSVFGGTPFSGTLGDLMITRGIWCGRCDVE